LEIGLYHLNKKVFMVINNAINRASKVTTYTSSDTWTKDVRTNWVKVMVFPSGQGGGSGRRGLTTVSGGGGGGCAGNGSYYEGPSSVFGNTETVTIGGTSNGGSAQTVDDTNGNPGNAANVSTFGNITTYVSASVPGGGTTTNAAGGLGSGLGTTFWLISAGPAGPNTNGGTGRNIAGSSSITGMVEASSGGGTSPLGGASGGGGGGADSVTERSGAAGQGFTNRTGTVITAGGTAGLESTIINGGDGNPMATTGGLYSGGTGGGGGGGQKSGVVAGNGGTGGIPCGSGGGGGGSLNGTNSGAGGNGARGQIIVIEFF
jgi:hypothetical protein